jgi:dTDP-4-amino-4,6-dideoxygalactose transaminase
MIPFVDLISQHRSLEDELMDVFRLSLQTASFIGGPQVQGLEDEFAQFCKTEYCIGVNSGTDALRFALLAAGIGAGDEVITVPNTFIATTEAISQTGARPAFVDIDERTYNMDPNKLEDYLKERYKVQGTRSMKNTSLGASEPNIHPVPCTMHVVPRPRAVVPVHLYGQPADMDAILEIAERYGLIVIEDACQAHGAEYFSGRDNRWKKAGSMGLAAAFSFYPGKNLGACGEGGAVTTNDEKIAQQVRMIRDHGQTKKYFHDLEGYNGRLDAIQAGILRIKLRHLPSWNDKRRKKATVYNELLNSSDAISTPYELPCSKAVYHLYVIRTPKRDEIKQFLLDGGIATGLHYPIPLHLQNAYSALGYKRGDFPVSEKVASEILSLPMFPGLNYQQQQCVIDRIEKFFVS